MTPLIRKLGIRVGIRVHVHDAPPVVLEMIEQVDDLQWVGPKEEADYPHLFVSDVEGLLGLLDRYVKNLANDGMLWVSWPKKSSGVKTDLNRDMIRDIILETGLVDIKVCSVDEIWSGLNFVRGKKDRK